MSVPAAYLGVIVIWATTPLAIKWSGEGAGFLFGVTGRMVVGAAVAALTLLALGQRLRWHRRARLTYMVAGLGIYGGMLSVYWASQHIPSGWISVLFGTAPIVTSLMAALWLDERALTVPRLVGMTLGVAGLAVMFATALEVDKEVGIGVAAVLLATACHSASAVWIKRLDARLPGLTVTTGGLMVAVALFLLTWFASGATWPAQVPHRAGLAILYLGVVGSVVGFALYYHVLGRVAVTRVALITLITPVCALLIGAVANGEPLTGEVWAGTALISLGLLTCQLGGDRLPASRD